MHSSVAVARHHEEDRAGGEALLVRRACDDPLEFEVLFHRYRDRIYWYLRARTPSEEDAADLTQHVFLSALDRLGQYRERKGTFAAWLFAIARHAATDFHRRRKTTIDWESLPAALHPIDRHDVEADAVGRETFDQVRRLISALPGDKREVLALRFAGGLSIAEIASIIGKSPEATRKQLSRTLQTLEDQYHDLA